MDKNKQSDQPKDGPDISPESWREILDVSRYPGVIDKLTLRGVLDLFKKAGLKEGPVHTDNGKEQISMRHVTFLSGDTACTFAYDSGHFQRIRICPVDELGKEDATMSHEMPQWYSEGIRTFLRRKFRGLPASACKFHMEHPRSLDGKSEEYVNDVIAIAKIQESKLPTEYVTDAKMQQCYIGTQEGDLLYIEHRTASDGKKSYYKEKIRPGEIDENFIRNKFNAGRNMFAARAVNIVERILKSTNRKSENREAGSAGTGANIRENQNVIMVNVHEILNPKKKNQSR